MGGNTTGYLEQQDERGAGRRSSQLAGNLRVSSIIIQHSSRKVHIAGVSFSPVFHTGGQKQQLIAQLLTNLAQQALEEFSVLLVFFADLCMQFVTGNCFCKAIIMQMTVCSIIFQGTLDSFFIPIWIKSP